MSATIGKGEEVLLQISNVKCRKGSGDGKLYVLLNRIFWVSDVDNSTISHNYDEIKVQKISPDGKSKIQLQICLLDGDNSTFQFTSPEGTTKQIQDRDRVKELLQQSLFKCKMKLDGDLEKKQKILQENRELFNLYKDLVTTNVVTADEFWQNYAGDKLKPKSDNNAQKVGVSPGFLSDVTKTDGCNGIKLNLTAEIIESVFRTYPSIKKKHFDLVPHEMTEKEFWTKFFESQYFHRDRLTNPTPQEMFSDCLKLDDEDLRTQANVISSQKRTIADTDEDFGLATNVDPDADDRKIRNPVHTALMRKFNYRSGRVLQACLGDDLPSSSNGIAPSLGSLLPTTSKEQASRLSKKPRLNECNELEADERVESLTLKLNQSEKYQIAASDNDSSARVIQFPQKDVVRWCSKVSNAVQNWNRHNVPLVNDIIDTGTAYAVLLDVSSGGSLVPGRMNNLQEIVPKSLLEEIRNLYLASNELLRHFWCCFPTTTPELEQKLVRMHDTLRRFDETKLKQWHEKLNGHYSLATVNLIGHLQSMLHTAYTKFDGWSQKKINLDQK